MKKNLFLSLMLSSNGLFAYNKQEYLELLKNCRENPKVGEVAGLNLGKDSIQKITSVDDKNTLATCVNKNMNEGCFEQGIAGDEMCSVCCAWNSDCIKDCLNANKLNKSCGINGQYLSIQQMKQKYNQCNQPLNQYLANYLEKIKVLSTDQKSEGLCDLIFYFKIDTSKPIKEFQRGQLEVFLKGQSFLDTIMNHKFLHIENKNCVNICNNYHQMQPA